MTTTTPRDEGSWAPKTERLTVASDVAGVGYNVSGRRIAGPHLGFGRLWQRDYWVDLGASVTPVDLVADWKVHFADFWPKGGTIHAPLDGLHAGDVAPLELGPGHGPKLATGIVVIYADDESFTFMTPEGHMFAGMITFSAEEVDSGTRVRIRILLRTNDPLYELGWPLMKRAEDVFWPKVLVNLATAHGVANIVVDSATECLDRKRVWRNWRNVRYNAGIRSAWHTLSAPLRRR